MLIAMGYDDYIEICTNEEMKYVILSVRSHLKSGTAVMPLGSAKQLHRELGRKIAELEKKVETAVVWDTVAPIVREE